MRWSYDAFSMIPVRYIYRYGDRNPKQVVWTCTSRYQERSIHTFDFRDVLEQYRGFRDTKAATIVKAMFKLRDGNCAWKVPGGQAYPRTPVDSALGCLRETVGQPINQSSNQPINQAVLVVTLYLPRIEARTRTRNPKTKLR